MEIIISAINKAWEYNTELLVLAVVLASIDMLLTSKKGS